MNKSCRNFKIQFREGNKLVWEDEISIPEKIIKEEYNGNCNGNVVKHYWLTNPNINSKIRICTMIDKIEEI